eukprot:2939859-Lingulodinium_polyedra.AAC.1
MLAAGFRGGRHGSGGVSSCSRDGLATCTPAARASAVPGRWRLVKAVARAGCAAPTLLAVPKHSPGACSSRRRQPVTQPA